MRSLVTARLRPWLRAMTQIAPPTASFAGPRFPLSPSSLMVHAAILEYFLRNVTYTDISN